MLMVAAEPMTYEVRNELLATMDDADFGELRPHLQFVELKRNDILHDAHRRPDSAYFIESGVVSRVARTARDGAVEVAMVARLGFVGISVVLGTMRTTQRTVVQVAGVALRIDADELRRIMNKTPSIRDHLLKYVHALIDFEAQLSLCNARHGVDKRVARWLLLAQERIGGDLVPVTHNTIASALGVRRPGVSKIIADLEVRQIVEGSRGSLRILDIEGLRRIACECPRIVNQRFRMFQELPHYQHMI
jgi:CRP-like cAMP-binding protein